MKIKNYIINYINDHCIRGTPVIVEVHNRTCNKDYIIKKSKLVVNREYCQQFVKNKENIDILLDKAVHYLNNTP